MAGFTPAVPGASYALSELEIKNNPDLAVVDSHRIRGGGFSVATLELRNQLPVDLRKANVTRCYVESENATYVLRAGIENTHWKLEGSSTGSAAGLRIGQFMPVILADIKQVMNYSFPLNLFAADGREVSIVSVQGLPNGLLLLDENTRISGAPTEWGRFGLLINVADSLQNKMQVGAVLQVNQTLTITNVTYNANTQYVNFGISGGDGTVIEYSTDPYFDDTVFILPDGSSSTSLGLGTQYGTWRFHPVFHSIPPGVTLKLYARQSGYLAVKEYATLGGNILNQAPTVANPIGDQTATVGQLYTYKIPANTFADDKPITGLSITIGNKPAWLTYNADTQTLSGTPITAGTYDIQVMATDASAVSVTDTFKIVVAAAPNQAPVVTNPVADQQAVVGQAYSQVISANTFSDPDGTIASIGVSGLPAGLTFTSGTRTIAGTPTGAGTSTITVTATDNGGKTVADTYLIVVAASPLPPTNQRPVVANPIGNKSATVGQAYTQVIPGNTFADADGSIASITVSGLPSGLSFNAITLTISGTPTVAGTATIIVTATDNGGLTVTDTFALVVATAPNQAPIVANPIPDKQAVVGQAYSQTIPGSTFSDPDGTIASIGVSGLPSGLTYSAVTLTISGTPTAAGTAMITVTATDNGGKTITDTFNLTVQAEPSTNSDKMIVDSWMYTN